MSSLFPMVFIKMAVTILVLAVAAAPALAKTKKRAKAAKADHVQSYSDRTVPSNDPYSIVQNGKVLGRDPDQGIRFQIWREGDPANFGPD